MPANQLNLFDTARESLNQLGIALGYVLIGMTMQQITINDTAVVFWPSSGLALAILLIGGRRYLLAVFVGALGCNALFDSSPVWIIGASLAALTEAQLALWLLNRVAGFSLSLETLSDYLRLLAFGGAVPCIVGAVIGVASMVLAGMPHGNYLKEVMHWWMGDTLGVALITPLILSWGIRKLPRPTHRQLWEGLLLLLITFVAGQIIFLDWFYGVFGDTPRTFPIFLLITIIASRLGVPFTSVALCMIALQGLAGSYEKYGYFAHGAAETVLNDYWFYMMTLSGVGMSLAAYVTERKRSEQRLVESECFLRAIIDNEPECIKVVDRAGYVMQMNRAGLAALEAESLAQVQDRQVFDVIAPECRAAYIELHSQVLSGQTVQMEFEVIGLKGRRRLMETHAVPMMVKGEMMHMAITRDITKQRAAEILLRESRRLLDSIVEHIPIMVFVKRAGDLRFELVNPAGIRLMGCRAADVVGKGNDEIWPKAQADAFTAVDRQVLASDSILEIPEEEMNTASGETRYMHTWKVAIRDEKGEATHLLGITIDITEKIRMEQELLELLSFTQTVVNKSDMGIMVHRQTGECVMANEAAALIVGATNEQLKQHNFRQSPVWQESGLIAAADEAFRTGFTQRFLKHVVTVYGKEIWCSGAFSSIIRNGAPHSLLVFSDVSLHRQAEAGMRQAKEEAEAALARAMMAERRIVDVSEHALQRIGQELHDDLGQQLTGLAFLAEVLCQDLKKYDLPLEVQAASKVTSLINKTVSHVRQLAHGMYPIELKEAGLKQMLINLAISVEASSNLECRFSSAGHWRLNDASHTINLYRIAQEAISNAIRHGKATRIGLSLSQGLHERTLEINDNGRGIKDGAQSGLGMHTMQYRAAMMGGTLRISPASHDETCRGTRVLITIPAS